MAKDYKESNAPRESRLAHPMLLGMIMGLLLGILISLAVALWLNRLSNPFMEKARPVDPLPRVQPTAPTSAPEPQKPARPPEKSASAEGTDKARTGDRPRFEFYQILPGTEQKGSSEKLAKAAPVAPPAVAPVPAAPPRPGSSPATPKPHAGDLYWLQAGAFSDEKEADNQKARIALTGLEATVRTADVPGRGTLYRVRLGPYESVEDANRMKAALAQNGVQATIIHTTEDAKTP
ncbi:MAG: SPOR domain-containing protein [Betaproteobacteria bacterium]|nr:SPOR domain-containing protein [Betaproteobacteria bacterium]